MRVSIRTKLYVLFAWLGVILVIMLLNFSMNRSVNEWKRKQAEVIGLKNRFLVYVAKENAAFGHEDQVSELMTGYMQIHNACISCHDTHPSDLFIDRNRRIETLHKQQLDSNALNQSIYDNLNVLTESVRYIHEHHIANLKNLLKRNKLREYAYPDEAVSKSPVRSAPELTIINQTVAIQNILGDILKNFYALKNVYYPDLESEFAGNMESFNKAVIQFESSSLDAQDGLLVEELLDSGNLFQSTFRQLLAIAKDKDDHLTWLASNQQEILSAVSQTVESITLKKNRITYQLTILTWFSLGFIVLLILIIIYQGMIMIRSLNHLISETEKITHDYQYQLAEYPKSEKEFHILSQTLAQMAQGRNDRIKKLNREIQLRIKTQQEKNRAEVKLQQAKKMEAIGLLAGGVAHDLNNILSGIINYPELILLDLPRDSKLRKPIEAIQESGLRAAAIVKDLLTVARGVAVTKEPVDLNELIREYLVSPEFYKLKEFHPFITVKNYLSTDIFNTHGSYDHIRKTVMNLVSNAAEAVLDDGTITISTQNRYLDLPMKGYNNVKKGEYVVLSISDNGLGIPLDDLSKIFEPFYTKKVMGRSGTGLGLAVVWNVMLDHQGYIDVKSSDRGTTFELFFPSPGTK